MWKLDYDGTLLLRIPAESMETFIGSSFYKLSLKRYVRENSLSLVRFKPALTYLDFKKVILLCQRETEKKQIPFVVSKALQDYIESRELHIEVRSKLGVELKERSPKLQERFNSYRTVIDRAMARKLREKQAWDSFFMCAMQKSANFSVPGSGKTASVLGMYAYLREKNLIKRILVVCPKNAFGSWIDEFSVCFHGIEQLKVLNIHDPKLKNTTQRKTALQYDSGRYNLILVNYESIGGILESLISLVTNQTLLVFDEVHKVKRIHGTYAENALHLAKEACYAVAMTGTPIPNSYGDIYNLLHILYPQEYDEFFNFTAQMLRNPSPDDIKTINDKLQPFFCRTTKNQLGVPEANRDSICVAAASSTENQILKILQMKYRGNKLALLVRILQLESNPQMLLKALDMSDFSYLLDDSEEISEIDFVDYSDEVKKLIETCGQTTKFQQCSELVSSLVKQGKSVIIWCMFVDSIRNLAHTLENQGIRTRCIYGEVPLDERLEILDAFRNGEIQVLLTNPHTLAESVSLHSVCHDAVYFEYSYNLVHLLQSKDRIHRLGLPKNQYTQYYFHQIFYETENGSWSMDEAVYQRLQEKEKIMLDAIDNHVLEAMPTSEEDLEIIFAKL